MFQTGLARNPGANFLGHRVNDSPFVWQTFGEVQERMKNLGSGLVQLAGLASGAESMVGMFFKNSPAFVIVDGACAAYSLVSVPMYDTFDLPALQYIINHTGISVVVISSANLDKALTGSNPVLKHLVVTDLTVISEDIKQRAAAFNIRVTSMKDVELLGKKNPKEMSPPSPEDLVSYLF
jgi:long-chain acyl-CoA synthetase